MLGPVGDHDHQEDLQRPFVPRAVELADERSRERGTGHAGSRSRGADIMRRSQWAIRITRRPGSARLCHGPLSLPMNEVVNAVLAMRARGAGERILCAAPASGGKGPQRSTKRKTYGRGVASPA